MKRVLLATLVSILFASAGLAQMDDWRDPPFGNRHFHGVLIRGFRAVGIQYGTGSSTLVGHGLGRLTEATPAWNLGLYTTYQMTDLYGIQSELRFSRRGGYHQFTEYIEEVTPAVWVYGESTWDVDYLEVPVLLRVGQPPFPPGSKPLHGRGNPFRYYAIVGPSFGFLLDERYEDAYELNNPGGLAPDRVRACFEHAPRRSLSFVMGAGGDMHLGGGYISAGVRLMVGLWDFGETGTELNTLALSFDLGYGFGLY